MPDCPSHVEGFVEDAREGAAAVEFHFYFQIVCRGCDERKFHLSLSNRQSVIAQCPVCGKKIVVYDLAFYPAATKRKGEEAFAPLEATYAEALPVYVSYEYGELDEDQELDRDDITWCQVFVEKEGRPFQIFEDETA